jgi:hypothetical protein
MSKVLLLMLLAFIIGSAVTLLIYSPNNEGLEKVGEGVKTKCREARARAQVMKSDDEHRLKITAQEMSAWIELCGKGEQAKSIRDGVLTPGKFGDVRKALSEI